MACMGCEQLPTLPADAGRLVLAPPLGHSRGKLLKAADNSKLVCEADEDGLIQVKVGRGELAEMLLEIQRHLSRVELEKTNAVFMPAGQPRALEFLPDVKPLSQWVGLVRGQWLVALLSKQRLTSHFQPIVHTADPSQVYAHECLLRGLDEQGQLLSPGALFDAARAADMLFHLDRAARLTAIEQALGLGLETPIFINFTPTSIYDPAYCLRTTIAAALKTGREPSSFVFEVIETEEVADSRDLVEILREYRAAGFRVALDDLGAGYGSLTLLERLRPDIVKLDRALIDGVDQSASKQAVVSALVKMAEDLGIATVGEGVETRAEWEWLRASGIDYVQGFLFGRPSNPPVQPTSPLD